LPNQVGPTARGRRLAAELRRLRERTGLTGEEVAERLGWSGSKVSRIELHRTGVKLTDLRQLLDLYGIGESHREELLALARESSQRSRLEQAMAGFPAQIASYVHAEAEALSVWNWEPQVVPGLLQTPAYARAMMRPGLKMFPGPSSQLDRRVEARMLRQQVLTRNPPFKLAVIMDESVLWRRHRLRGAPPRQLLPGRRGTDLPVPYGI
jgi:transcriptional regulator with XRE-family HTH domain